MNRGETKGMYEDVIEEYEKRVLSGKQEITIFIITYNREHYLKLAIESVLRQTYSNFSVIVLDNFSSDGTEHMVNSIKDDRLLYIKHVSDLKTGDSNMRYAFQLCKTDYMVVFHDDDTIEPNFIDNGLAEIKKTDCVALSVGGRIIDEEGNYTGETWNSHSKMLFKDDEYFSFFFSHNADSMLYPSVIYRREFFDDLKKYVTVMDVGPCNDQYLWFQICRYGGQICMDNLNLMNYRIHINQDSQLNIGLMDYEFIDALQKDEYYKKLISKNKTKIQIRIFSDFIKITRNYYDKRIDLNRFDQVFGYKCIENLKQSLSGMLIYVLIRIIYKNRCVAENYLKFEKWRKSK